MKKLINITGEFEISPRLNDYDKFYLFNFNATRHLKRDPFKLEKLYNGRNCYKGNYGEEGEFFVNYIYDINYNKFRLDNHDIERDISTIINDNEPPKTQPNIYCPWIPNETGDKLIFKGNDYFNHYGWLKWLLKNIFKNTYNINGELNISSNVTNKEKIIIISNNKINLKSKERTPDIQNIKKTDSEIINDIIDLTTKKELEWIKEKTNITILGSINYKYISILNITNNINLILNLFIYTDFSKNYINIYMGKNNKTRYIKNVKNYYKINKLLALINGEKQ